MSYWAKSPQSRDQMVLFAARLDDALPAEHTIRLLDEILGRIDWSPWEAGYHGRLGQPPIHPRVSASVILYGLLKRIRSSRCLEEALQVRLDFRWLADGRTIDHATLSEFRRRHAAALKDLFVRIALAARRLGLLPLEQLAFDGTRPRANNRRGGTRTPQELREMRKELSEKFAELERRVAAELWNRLPTKPVKNRSGEKQTQLTKEAFVYDAARDCYWCPAGKKLSPEQSTGERCGAGRLARTRYKAEQAACGACPLRERCLQKNAKRREVSRYGHEHLTEKLRQRMATPEARTKYARRREVGERPFAVIKQQFGARRFLLRGLAKVRIERRRLTTAFNLERLMSLPRSRAGPAAALS